MSAALPGLVEAVALLDTARLLADRSKTTGFAVLGSKLAPLYTSCRSRGTNLVHRLADPVDAGIAADSLVLGIDEDNLVVLVGGVLVDPVRVQDTQVAAAATNTLLGSGTERALVLELVNTLVGGLACSNRSLSAKSDSFPVVTPRDNDPTYRNWHPWARASCVLRGGHERGR